MEISALVVTYNRIDYLKECIESLLNQTVKLESIIIFDNASTDDTKNYFENFNDKRIIYIRSEENLGGAGGFKQGMKYFIESTETEYLWIMDDDTIPKKNALEKFIDGYYIINNQEFGFMSSNVRWIDGSAAKMNIPMPAKEWNHIYTTNGIISIRRATFVSLLVSRKVINEVGYPIEEFFIWGDDSEFTERISQKYPSYFINDSIVIHKMLENNSADIVSDSESRISRYKYAYRNRLYYNKMLSKQDLIKQLLRALNDILKVVKNSQSKKKKRIRYIVYGTWLGLFFNPTIEYPIRRIKK